MEILAATAGIFGIRGDKCQMDKAEIQAYREAFSNFDWNHNGKISYGSLLPAMRRAGVNPTEVDLTHYGSDFDSIFRLKFMTLSTS